MTRSEIESMYEKLNDLKEMEYFLKMQNGEDKRKWLKLNTPDTAYSFLNGNIRKTFLDFVEDQIKIIQKELELVD